ncbi:hypothetical protein BDQ12DRAFT_691404 [Crucibulum laeve]|uniref:Uncharacterized protein n=1 Tax=Crucibulum laeve TaxID=68775 RepID=A0A5C3LJB6_9AGAR|nr:hypothetical protein BDQ12DRAFT_691404 [Crucibulum laeve]
MMDMTGMYDEVVADSEDEDVLTGASQRGTVDSYSHVKTPIPAPASAISEFTNNIPSRMIPSIATLIESMNPGAIDPIEEGSSTIKPRPKPRPKAKGKESMPDGVGDSSISSFQTTAYDPFSRAPAGPSFLSEFQIEFPTSSIADRAKTRQRNSKPTPAFHNPTDNILSATTSRKRTQSSEVIELTSEDDYDELALRPLKAKAKHRPKPKATASPAAASTSSNPIIDQSKPRIKPRPLAKRSKTTHSTPPPEVPLSTLPIATSPIRMPMGAPARIPLHPLSSQLPPSDPPLPSTATDFGDGLPAIAVLPNPGTDFDAPPSSLSSLFDPPFDSSPGRKRKARMVDELDSDFEIPRKADKDGDVSMLPPAESPLGSPPPTFFAGSSSSSISGVNRRAAEPAPPAHIPEMVDPTIFPPNLVPAASTKGKAKKPRKKKGEVESMPQTFNLAVDPNAPTPTSDDSTVDTPSTSKVKAKGAVKPKKKAPAPKKQQQMEVLITIPPLRKGKAKEKESFKSREFIDDDNEDELGLAPPAEPPIGPSTTASMSTTIAPLHKPASTSSLSSVPDSDGEAQIKIPSKSRKRKSIMDDDDEDGDAYIDGVSPKKVKGKGKVKATNKAKEKGKGKPKAKTVVQDDDDDDFLAAATAASSSTRKKSKSNARRVMLSDEDELSGWLDEEPEHSVIHVRKRGAQNKEPKEEEEMDKIKAAKEAKEKGQEKEVEKEEKPKGKRGKAKKGKQVISETEEPDKSIDVAAQEEREAGVKENIEPSPKASSSKAPNPAETTVKPTPAKESLFPSLSSRYTHAPKVKSTPMSELIRRVNSLPGSPFVSPASRGPSALSKRSLTHTAYSSYAKASKSALSRIAPLHPNRRTPPPPLPPPPPRKKTKKELEMEEKWEEELVESVGGITEWACMTDAERKEMRRIKREREMGGWED